MLSLLATSLEPLRVRHRLPPYVIEPGSRLRTHFGRCEFPANGSPPKILVRCTAHRDRRSWRALNAVISTLLHEMAHLRHANHASRFWALHRRLLDEAASLGLYEPCMDDLSERGRGAEKLAGSAGEILAQAARERRRSVSATNRAAAREWQPGEFGTIPRTHGRLAGVRLRVLSVGRSRLTVQAPDGRLYLVSASLVVKFET
jgi:hypothetical protein